MKKEKLIKRITNDADLRGFDVRIRDIAYALLKVKFEDPLIAYTVVFGTPEKDSDVEVYNDMESVKYLCRWMKKDLAPKEVEKKTDAEIIKELVKKEDSSDNADSGAITFAENRAGMEEQIREIREVITKGRESNTLDDKTFGSLQKTLSDLRARLNDKFGAAEKSGEQYIIVQPKYDMVCPHTRRECYQMTKERAMEKWNLIEKKL